MSTPITYIGMWDKIRDIFAQQPAALERNYTSGHFSFNTEHGACPNCKGDGSDALDMGAIGSFSRPCPECGGKRYRAEILEVTFKGYTIHDILSMSAEEAHLLFHEYKPLQQMLETLVRVGLG